MLNVSQSDPYGQRLTTYAQKLDSTANKWTAIDSSITSADRYVDSADRQFDQAWHPQRQASWDNERTDSSWHGRDLQRQFRYGDQEVDRSEGEVRRSSFDLSDLKKEITQTDGGLDQLITEMRASNDPRLPLVLQASDEIAKAEGNFNGVSGGFQRFDSSARWVSNSVFRAENDIYAISADRPGKNVSHYAHQVGNVLRDIDRDLQNMDWALSDADRQGDQGQGTLRSAAQKLMQASSTAP
jgi:hypothetical protein